MPTANFGEMPYLGLLISSVGLSPCLVQSVKNNKHFAHSAAYIHGNSVLRVTVPYYLDGVLCEVRTHAKEKLMMQT